MGSAGHAFTAHTKALSPAASVSDGGWGTPPHPLRVRPGQRFWPLAGRNRRAFQVVRVHGDRVRACRLDGAREHVTLSARRLLAVRADGRGRHYAFTGFASRGYRTYAVIVDTPGGDDVLLVIPEWHPARPVRLRRRELPALDVELGRWLLVNADLSAAHERHLSLVARQVISDPGEQHSHRAVYDPGVAEVEPTTSPVPAIGRGCGDIVLRLPERQLGVWIQDAALAPRRLTIAPQRPPAIHHTGPTPALPAGARIFLTDGSSIAGFVVVDEHRRLPSGDLFIVSQLQPAAHTAAVAAFHGWRWRWWPI